MPKRTSQLRGIVVVADTQEQALDHYRAVASGTYQVLESKDGKYAIATAQNAGIQLLNPLNGEEMVVVPEDEQHEMVATASADGDLDAFYVACSSGCGSHVFAENEDLLQNCPTCASALPQTDDNTLPTQNQGPQEEILLAVADTQQGAVDAFRALASGACETFAAKCEDVMVISNQPLKYDIYSGTAAETVDGYVPQLSVASDNGKTGVHYLITAASESGEQMHIVSTSQGPLFCPETLGCLIDPADSMSEAEKATASAAFANTATASDEEDEEEEDDFEEDEEDEDFEDDDEDEEEEDEEEEDEDLSLTLASSVKNKKGGARKKVKPNVATASAIVPEKVDVVASFVGIASSEMDASSIDVAFVGTVANEPTWLAFHNGVPFAKAVASAAENPATFADSHFGRAFKAVASAQGVDEALKQLRFEEIRPTVQVDAVVAEQIASQVTAQTASIAEAASRDTANLSERFEAAIAIASQGVNVGFFKDLKNPIRIAIASTLNDLGIQNGDELLQKAFGEHHDEYTKQILAKASEIMQYDMTVQNQMAKAVMDVEPENVATASSVSVGRPVNTPQNQKPFEATASASDKNPTTFQNKLAGLKFK